MSNDKEIEAIPTRYIHKGYDRPPGFGLIMLAHHGSIVPSWTQGTLDGPVNRMFVLLSFPSRTVYSFKGKCEQLDMDDTSVIPAITSAVFSYNPLTCHLGSSSVARTSIIRL
jgi:hypothetical protein